MAKKIIISLINLYQQTLSLDHGWLGKILGRGSCRFYPTCSEYSKQAVEKYGVMTGIWLGLRRVIRCNPFNMGGVDILK